MAWTPDPNVDGKYTTEIVVGKVSTIEVLDDPPRVVITHLVIDVDKPNPTFNELKEYLASVLIVE